MPSLSKQDEANCWESMHFAIICLDQRGGFLRNPYLNIQLSRAVRFPDFPVSQSGSQLVGQFVSGVKYVQDDSRKLGGRCLGRASECGEQVRALLDGRVK